MEIKFWDVVNGKYITDTPWLTVDDDMRVYQISNQGICISDIKEYYQPHFYLNGERVA